MTSNELSERSFPITRRLLLKATSASALVIGAGAFSDTVLAEHDDCTCTSYQLLATTGRPADGDQYVVPDPDGGDDYVITVTDIDESNLACISFTANRDLYKVEIDGNDPDGTAVYEYPTGTTGESGVCSEGNGIITEIRWYVCADLDCGPDPDPERCCTDVTVLGKSDTMPELDDVYTFTDPDGGDDYVITITGVQTKSDDEDDDETICFDFESTRPVYQVFVKGGGGRAAGNTYQFPDGATSGTDLCANLHPRNGRQTAVSHVVWYVCAGFEDCPKTEAE